MDIARDLQDIAERLDSILSHCSNEESTKQFLVLPVLRTLGYDCTDPRVVQPEYIADFGAQSNERVDYVVLQDGTPVIAIECKKVGSRLEEHRGQLRAYFAALPTVRLGILTDGLQFEFFIDSDNSNVMDEEPFLTLDLKSSATERTQSDVAAALGLISRSKFDPYAIEEFALSKLIMKRLRKVLTQEITEPSEEFCRLVLQRVGVGKGLRAKSIQERYASYVRTAFQEAFVMPVVEMLRLEQRKDAVNDPDQSDKAKGIITTDREKAIFSYVCRRLAFLAENEREFAAIEKVGSRDYLGHYSIYLQNVQKGLLLKFIEGKNGYDTFVFPDGGTLVTNVLADIDEPLRKTFRERVKDLVIAPKPSMQRIA